jgi:hypothetical protein
MSQCPGALAQVEDQFGLLCEQRKIDVKDEKQLHKGGKEGVNGIWER